MDSGEGTCYIPIHSSDCDSPSNLFPVPISGAVPGRHGSRSLSGKRESGRPNLVRGCSPKLVTWAYCNAGLYHLPQNRANGAIALPVTIFFIFVAKS